ncbi:MAG: glycosyltransferase family 4 protein [Nitrosopumilus sp.]
MVFHFPPISGGGVVVIVELANKFAELGHNVTVVTPNLEWSGEKYNPKLNKKILVNKIETPSRTNLKIAARRCMDSMKKEGIRIGKEQKFDFIFTIFHPFHLVPKAAVSCGKVLKIPVIIKVDDAIYQKASGLKNLQRKLEKIYNSKTLQQGNKILVPNQYTKELVSQYYNVKSDKISIITNGTEVKNYQESNLDSDQIIFSGAMYHHRGIDILLEAVYDVVKEKAGTKFVLLGNGPELNQLKKITSEKKLEENVDFKGWIDRNEIPKYLAASSIGIGPLRSTEVTKHALPIKVLEYMSAGLPIIAAKDTLPEDVLEEGKNGFFIKDSKELGKKILELLNNKELRKRMGKNSKEMVSKFDWKNVTELVIQEAEKIISLSK